MEVYLGVDVGSVTTKMVLLDGGGGLLASCYLRTQGRPIEAVQRGLADIAPEFPPGGRVRGVGTTGSARHLAGVILGADVVKNEITCQALAALHYLPEARTVVEVGGQDSKIIILRDGVVVDFAMNTVCAAGTGSFLDQQAARLGIGVEEFGRRAQGCSSPVRISGSCTVFAESDMVSKQQMGYRAGDIIYGLCQALARNYLSNVGMGRDILPPLVFQGGVASNGGMVRAFEEILGLKVVVHPHHQVSGAIGAALLAQEGVGVNGKGTRFKGFEASHADYRASSFDCEACPSACEIAQLSLDGKAIARWGGRCDLWEEVSEVLH